MVRPIDNFPIHLSVNEVIVVATEVVFRHVEETEGRGVEHLSNTTVTKYIATIVINLVTPEAAAMRELLCYNRPQ
jgi:hypothetical protein